MRLLLALFTFAQAPAPVPPPPSAPPATLAGVRRVFVESLGSAPEAVLLRDMVISSLAGSGLIAVTENSEHADATLRGSAQDQTFTEQHSSHDSITAGLRSGSSGSYSSKYDRSSNAKNGGVNIGQTESMEESERRHEASASVRLINRDGDVIWSTTQESLGAKFRSSSADVADKVFHKLSSDIQLARSRASAATEAGMPVR